MSEEKRNHALPSQRDLFLMAGEDPSALLAVIQGGLPDHLLTYAAEAVCEVSNPDESLISAVRKLLTHPTAYVREGALYGLSNVLGREDILASVVQVSAHDEDDTVRMVASELLEAEIGERVRLQNNPLMWHELSHTARLGLLAGATARLSERIRKELEQKDVVTDVSAEELTPKGSALRDWAESIEWLAEKADLKRGALASALRYDIAAQEGHELSSFLTALQQRVALLEFLRIRGLDHKILGPEARDREGAVRFEKDGETWVSEYTPSGRFKQLVWA